MQKIKYHHFSNPKINNVNAYLFIDEAKNAILFDLGFSAPTIIDYLHQEKLNLQLVFLTHYHLDHSFGIEELMQQFLAPVYLGQLDHPILKDAQLNGSMRFFPEPWILKNDENFQDLTDEGKIACGSFLIQYYVVGGHSPGTTLYVVNNEFAIVGDTLFKEKIGFHNREGLTGYNDQKFWQSLNFIMNNFSHYKILPGHHEKEFLVKDILVNSEHEFFKKD